MTDAPPAAAAPLAAPRDASSRFVWPPVIYLVTALICGAISFVSNLRFVPGGLELPAIGLGASLIALGLAVAIAAKRRFTSAGTAVRPTQPTTAIVADGIYRYTRNPMYAGMTLILFGLGLMLNQLWFLLAVPLAMTAVTYLAIKREETYLERKFGAEYLAYKKKVRRWV